MPFLRLLTSLWNTFPSIEQRKRQTLNLIDRQRKTHVFFLFSLIEPFERYLQSVSNVSYRRRRRRRRRTFAHHSSTGFLWLSSREKCESMFVEQILRSRRKRGNANKERERQERVDDDISLAYIQIIENRHRQTCLFLFQSNRSVMLDTRRILIDFRFEDMEDRERLR